MFSGCGVEHEPSLLCSLSLLVFLEADTEEGRGEEGAEKRLFGWRQDLAPKVKLKC